MYNSKFPMLDAQRQWLIEVAENNFFRVGIKVSAAANNFFTRV
jgi:hypothetical protein